MIKKVIASLENVAKLVRSNADIEKVELAVKAARSVIQGFSSNGTQALSELDHELEIWLSKLSVILKEEVGKKGMIQHALFWVEKLKSVS